MREGGRTKKPLDFDNEEIVCEWLLVVNSRGKRDFVFDERSVVERCAEGKKLIALLQIAH